MPKHIPGSSKNDFRILMLSILALVDMAPFIRYYN